MAIKINTMDHISDQASTVKVDTTNTIWKNKSEIKTIQDVLETFDIISIEDKPATETKFGLVKLAKDSDIDSGIGTNDVVTSRQLLLFNGKPQASKTVYGTTRYATTTEVNNGVSDTTSVTPLELKKFVDTKTPSRSKYGLLKLSEQSMVIPGINDDTAMTPKLVKYAIDSLVPNIATATETVTGTITLATPSITQAGTIRAGYAISPYSFVNSYATESKVGTIRLATASEIDSGELRERVAVSPYGLSKLTSTTSRRGLVQLSTPSEVAQRTDNTKAVTPHGLGYYYDLIKDLESKITNLNNRLDNLATIPIGTILYSPNGIYNSNRVLACDGRWYAIATYPHLFAFLGEEYRVSPTHFTVPDYRGYFMRGMDRSGSVDPDGNWRGYRTAQGDAIRNIRGHYGSGALQSGWYGGALYQQGGQYTSYNGNNHKDGSNLMFDASRVVPTAPEVRPKNKAVGVFIMAV